MLEPIKRVLSFEYDDRPMDDSVYEFHRRWIKWLHDYYLRVEHIGALNECVKAARKERVILISNHSLTIEATLINYLLLQEGAGHVATLVFREAFKVPLVREFFRSCQCLPISVDAGAKALREKHILVFPEGMDFLNGLSDPELMSPFHTGFLRMADQHLKETRRKSITVVPIAHVGIEKMLKFWVIKNDKVMNTLIRPLVKYPFWVVPKLPFFLPSKVVFNWGKPIRLTRDGLSSVFKMKKHAVRFRQKVLDLRKEAQDERERTTWNLSLPFHAFKNFEP
ncbi:MAG: 1-acyl-sn-glycerol-3-phosphate acyltransferase [Deltaproteobacteria bacterium]|nr:1-acyl-sn-glycerol-3-phosphate acyltransferase [Deltaproteobacteria bacterium]